MEKTLLERLDQKSEVKCLTDSVLNQIQRIISTRTYIGSSPKVRSYVTGFGLPEIVDSSSTNDEQLAVFSDLIKNQILHLEPRISEVKINSINSSGLKASCDVSIKLEDQVVRERFYF